MRGAGDAVSVALVGCGRWGRHILRDLLELGCAVAVADASEDARRYAAAAGAASVVRDPRDLPSVAGVVVATPTATHAPVLDALLPCGVPVFCEKPLTAEAAGAEHLAARAGGRLFVMDKWRYHPGIELLRDLARSGELGAVQGVRTTRIGWANPHDDVDAVWILAPHDLSIALEVLGELPPPRAAVGERLGASAVGLLALLGGDPWVTLDVSVASPTPRREARLHCRAGVAVLPDPYSDHVLILRQGAPDERRAIASEPPLRRELRAFLAHLAGGAAPRSSAADGAAIVRMLERLRGLAGLDGAPA